MANPDPPGELDEVGRLIEAERWSEALRALGPLRRSDPSNPAVWRAQALALRGAGELQEAQYAADRWASLDEQSLDPVRLRLDLLDARGKHYAAVEVAEELTARTPDDADAFYRLARAQRAAGLVSRARDSIDRSLALDPLVWQSHELAGVIEMAGARPADAAVHFRDALRLDPDNGQLALSLQRAIEAQNAKQATSRSSDSKRKKETKQRAREQGATDKEREKRQAQAERAMRKGTARRDSSGRPISRWRRMRTAFAVVIVLALIVYLRYRG